MTRDLTKPSPDAELADLVSKYLDNRLDAPESERLEARIRQEPEALAYLAKRLRFEAKLRETINPQRMEVTESRRMIMEPGADGPEWSVEQQRSVHIGRPSEALTLDVSRLRNRRNRLLLAAAILQAALATTWLLWPRKLPPPPAAPPSVVLRNADFESTDLSLTPQGLTSSALEDWQDVIACPDVGLVEVNRYSNGRIFAKSGKNAALLRQGCYLTQRLLLSDGSPVRAADGLSLRLSGWIWIDTPPHTIEAALRVIASGRPTIIQYDACMAPATLTKVGWQSFAIDLTIQGELMRESSWHEHPEHAVPVLDLNGRELFLSIDSRLPGTILLDDLTIEEVHP
jgi:hypothetical protein